MDQRLNPWPLHWQAGSQQWTTRKVPHGPLIEITHLVSGSNEVQVLDVLSQDKFSETQTDM